MPKGGVGKTTISAHIGYELSLFGKTLLIDADPQGNLTHHVITPEVFQRENKSLLNCFESYQEFENNLVIAREPNEEKNNKGLYLLPTETNSEGLQTFIQGKFMNKPDILKLIIKKAITNQFEYVLFDPPAFFGAYTRGMLTNSTDIIPIIELEEFGFASIFTLIEELNEIQEYVDEKICYNVAIVNKYDKKKAVNAHFMEQMEQSPFKRFVIRDTSAIPYAAARSQVLQEYMSNHTLNATFKEIAQYFKDKRGVI
jgi:cellulose biosynthesis protein BcsQ